MKLPVQTAAVPRGPASLPARQTGGARAGVVLAKLACNCGDPCNGSAYDCGSAGCICNASNNCVCKQGGD